LAFEELATMETCRRGQEIYSPGDPTENWYCVVSGLARKCAVARSGRRQIVDFLFPGDFFGLTARDRHAFGVEAVVQGTVVAHYPRRRVEIIADSNPRLGWLIREMAFEAISRLQGRMLILGRMTARQKVSAFLVEMTQRSADDVAELVVLPMSRYDIGDYLALSAETVSRVLTQLRQKGVIAFATKHQVRIVDRAALGDRDDHLRR
jgi:CRP/FNR family transcriptional regulator, nitrogen fixation regulation protein